MLRVAALLLASLALAPAAAHAATLTVDEHSTIHYTAGDGEANRLSMTVLDVGYAVIKDDAAPGLAACGTVWTHPGWRACPNARRPQVVLGDGDDEAAVADGGSEPMEWIGSAQVDAGAGDDDVRTGMSADVLLGGPGNDTLRPYFGANRVEGGAGDDTLESAFGDDTKIGGPGADTFLGHDGNETIDAADGAGTDTITCGEGTDTVVADHGDAVGAGCETVTRVGAPPREDEPPVAPRPTDPGTPPAGPVDTATPVTPADRPAAPAADVRAPGLTVKVKRARGRSVLTVRADEDVILRGAGRARRLAANATVSVVVRGARRRLRLVARDAAGNETVRRVRLR